MRYLPALLLLAAAGCTDSSATKLTADEATIAQLQADVAAMKMQMAAMPPASSAAVDTLTGRVTALETHLGADEKGLGDRLTALEGQKRVYLVAKAGTKDEAVIGLSSGGPGARCAMVPLDGGLFGEMCFYDLEVIFDGNNCTGNAFADVHQFNSLPSGPSLILTLSGEIRRVTGETVSSPGSSVQQEGACVPANRPPTNYLKTAKVGSLAWFNPSDVTAQLR